MGFEYMNTEGGCTCFQCAPCSYCENCLECSVCLKILNKAYIEIIVEEYVVCKSCFSENYVEIDKITDLCIVDDFKPEPVNLMIFNKDGTRGISRKLV